jgi:hypothetical protein
MEIPFSCVLTAMKRILFFSVFLLTGTVLHAIQELNAVTGDAWKGVYSEAYCAGRTERQKITAHLRYVELQLRDRPVNELTAEQRENREKLLDNLADYSAQGEFPVNEKFPGTRQPCFIDAHGKICAVGYLIEQSAGREAAESINARYQYSFIAEMRGLDEWMMVNGITAEECAMIQPTYNYSSGPSLKNKPNDSIAAIVSRKINYTGPPDTCVVAFQVNDSGKLVHEKVVSGNAKLGQAVLDVLKLEEYTPYYSMNLIRQREIQPIAPAPKKKRFWQKPKAPPPPQPEPENPNLPVVQMKFCYGIKEIKPAFAKGMMICTVPVQPLDSLSANVMIRGVLSDRATGESIPFARLRLYDSTDKVVATVETDLDGSFSLKAEREYGKNFYLVVTNVGYYTTRVDNIVYANQTLKVVIDSHDMWLNDAGCNSLSCMGTVYIGE